MTRRRSTPSAPRRSRTSSAFRERVQAARRSGDAGAELPLDPAGAGCRQRGDGGGAAPAPQAPVVDPWRGRAAAPRDGRRAAGAGRVRLHRGAAGGARPTCRCKRQAVLFRSSSHSDLLEVELAKRKIPFVKYGGLKFLEAGAHQGPARGAALGGQPAQYARRVPRPAAAARHGAGERARSARAPARRAATPSRRWRASPRRSRRASTGGEADRADAGAGRAAAAVGRARCTWCASGTSRISSASTSTSTPASGTSISSSCCRGSIPRASASSPSSRSIRRMPPATSPASRRSTRTTWC